MHNEIIDRLTNSLNILAENIELAKQTLLRRNAPQHVFDRLNTYVEMVQKQRAMTLQLTDYLLQNKFEEVSQSVRRINAMSEMIRDDARSLLIEVSKT